jgi:hypothetical protein
VYRFGSHLLPALRYSKCIALIVTYCLHLGTVSLSFVSHLFPAFRYSKCTVLIVTCFLHLGTVSVSP